MQLLQFFFLLHRESSLADIIEGIPPTFSRKPKAVCADENTDVELECRFVAVPEPEVAWYFNGKEVKTTETVTIVTQSDMHSYSSRVELKKVSKKQDGKYTLVVKNREGEAKIDIVLKVIFVRLLLVSDTESYFYFFYFLLIYRTHKHFLVPDLHLQYNCVNDEREKKAAQDIYLYICLQDSSKTF